MSFLRRLLEEPGRGGVPAVRAYAIRHRVPSFAFVVQEPDSPGAVDMERVRALGVRPGPKCAELKRGNKVRRTSNLLQRQNNQSIRSRMGNACGVCSNCCTSRLLNAI